MYGVLPCSSPQNTMPWATPLHMSGPLELPCGQREQGLGSPFSVILPADAQAGLCEGPGLTSGPLLVLRFHPGIDKLLLLPHEASAYIQLWGSVHPQGHRKEIREEDMPGTQAQGSFPLPPILPVHLTQCWSPAPAARQSS